jgi:hypothetical protein
MSSQGKRTPVKAYNAPGLVAALELWVQGKGPQAWNFRTSPGAMQSWGVDCCRTGTSWSFSLRMHPRQLVCVYSRTVLFLKCCCCLCVVFGGLHCMFM